MEQKLLKNTVRATGVSGIYKDKDIELIIAPEASDTKLLVDGKEVGPLCTGAWIKIIPGEKTKLFMEFVKTK